MIRCILFLTSILHCLYALAQLPPEQGSDLFRENVQANWMFSAADSNRWMKATVPGCVHTDLVKKRIIPDPLIGANEAGCQWVGEQDWIYRTEPFDLPARAQGREALMLRFNGLDTYATVLLNDEVILTANNAFRTWEVDVKKRMKKRGNVIEIRFRNPVKEAEKHLKLLPYPLPGDAQRAVSRKPQYHFGWDWGPRLLTCGITDAIELIAWDVARFQDVYVRQDKVNEKQADLTAIFELEVQREDPCSLFFYSPQTRETYATQVQLKKGMNLVELAMSIPYPRLWWCNGQGEPYLYTFYAWLKSGDKVVDQQRVRTGIRNIDLVTKKDSIGETFRFDLNGLPVFAKGANMIPMAYFPATATEEDYRTMLSKCRDAHFNMIRVWGGGVYEKDILYDLCDEYGIMVWQDFMFACSMYPADSLFIPNVIEEANQQTRRLRNHACLALWCGNNESAEGWARWGWQDGLSEKDRTRVKRAYDDLFTLTLEPIVKRNTTTDYWESSPRLGRGDPRSIFEGDSHYWGLWHDEEPFEVLQQKLPRFMSEFGMQSFPSSQAMRLMSDGNFDGPDRPGLKAHQKHPRGFELMEKYAERWYPGAAQLPLGKYARLTQVVQAEGMCAGIEAHRRSAPRCMGSLFWQLNDVWPSFSWSAIDYTGRDKLFFSMLKESFAPKLITYAIEDGKLRVWFLNDKVLPDTEKLDLYLAVRTYEGKELYRFASADNTLANGLQLLHEKSLREMGIEDPRDKVIIVELNDTRAQTRYRRYGKLVPASDHFYITWMENGAVIPQVLPE